MNIDTAYSEMVFSTWIDSFRCIEDSQDRAFHMNQNSGNPAFPKVRL